MGRRLQVNRQRIIERWARQAREEVPAAREQGRTELIDSLPVVLGELADALSSAETLGEVQLREQVLARVHGLSRALLRSYDVENVTREYDLLRRVILEVLEEESGLSGEAREVVLETIHLAVRSALEEFVRRREDERREVEAHAQTLAGEIALRERMYESILDATKDHLFVMDLGGRLTYANRATVEVLGRPARELLGRTVRELWTSADDIAVFEANLRRAAAGEVVVQELTFPTPWGPRRFEYALSPVRGDDGRVVAVVGATRDIEDRKRVEAERDRFFQLTPDLFCIAGADGYFKRVNLAFERTLGFSSEELCARPILEFVHPDDRATTEAEFRRLLGGESTRRFENRYLRRDGSYRWLAWATAPTEHGILYAAARDITDEKAARAEAESRARFEQQLIGIVSHDLKNPLQAVLLNATMLAGRPELDERARRTARRVVSSARRAVRMTRDLLDFTEARLGGGLPAAPSPCDLGEVVDQVVPDLEAAFPNRRIDVRHAGDARGRWDPDRLAQVVTNLATNALKYGDGAKPVRLETRAVDDRVVLTVHNDGPAIPADHRERLFEPMQRASTQQDAAGRSVGLGLYIVREIVRAHGGTVDVESTDEAGTTFVVSLPREVSASPGASAGRPSGDR